MAKDKALIFGVNPVFEKLKSDPAGISEIILTEKHRGPALRRIEDQARQCGVAVSYRPMQFLDTLAPGETHQGVLAKVKPYGYAPFSRVFEKSNLSPDLVLVLDGLTDPGNLGAVLRTAEASGVRHIVLPTDRSVGITPAVVKVSAGAVHHLSVSRVTNLRRALALLKEQGFWTAALDPHARETIYDRSFPMRLAVVLGSEGAGIRPLILNECDYRVSIPMRGRVASLNVSVAAGIFLYEILRQAKSR